MGSRYRLHERFVGLSGITCIALDSGRTGAAACRPWDFKRFCRKARVQGDCQAVTADDDALDRSLGELARRQPGEADVIASFVPKCEQNCLLDSGRRDADDRSGLLLPALQQGNKFMLWIVSSSSPPSRT